MASKKELLALVVDVGPHMHPHLDQAGQVLFNCVLSKLLFQPNHEIAIIFYGTTDTHNGVHDEMVASGDSSQYCNIAVQQVLQTPSLQYLTTLSAIPRGSGPSDFLDALVVTLDLMLRAVNERKMNAYNKRIVMLSNFAQEAKEMDPEFRQDMVSNMQELGVKLDVLCVEEAPEAAKAAQSASEQVLHDLLTEVRGQLHIFPQAMELTSYFKARDYSTNPTFRGELTIGKTLAIKVRVFKKTGKETQPSLKYYSDKAQGQATATHEVMRDTEYKVANNPDEPVPPEARVQAFRYGKQFVPLSKEDADALAFKPDRAFQVLGFVDAASIPRHHLIKDANVVVPDTASKESCTALSALTQALHRTGKVALVRCVLRARSSLYLGVLTPQPATTRRPDTLVLNTLPFHEDVRDYSFSRFSDLPEELIPSDKAQGIAVTKFVKALDLGGHDQLPKEHLQPERTVNPALQRFFTTLGHKALDPDAPLANVDELVNKTFKMQLDSASPTLTEAIEKLKAVFPITEAPKKAAVEGEGDDTGPQTRFAAHTGAVFQAEGGQLPGTQVQKVGTVTPVEDFEALAAAGKLQQAVSEMSSVVDELIGSSVGDRLYGKALDCVSAVRKGCVTAQQHTPFNDMLNSLCTKYEHHSEHKAFWQRIMAAGVTLIHSSECGGSDISQQQAEEFLRIHTATEGAVDVKMEAATEEQDEFDEFE